MDLFPKDAKSPLTKLLDIWRKDQIEQIGVLRNIPIDEIEDLTLRLYHAIACADCDNCEEKAISTPKVCYNHLAELCDCKEQSAYKHYTAMICEIIMLCLQLSGSIRESHAIGFLSYALKEYPDVKTSMWDFVNHLGLKPFQEWVEGGCCPSGYVEKKTISYTIPTQLQLPKQDDYVEVLAYIKNRGCKDSIFKEQLKRFNTERELCAFLTNEIGWVVEANSYNKAKNRQQKKQKEKKDKKDK